jgi:hypothetical protein
MENLTESTKPDILIGNESWLHKDIQSTEVFTSRYIPYRNDRKTYAHGGVFILVSEKYVDEYHFFYLQCNPLVVFVYVLVMMLQLSGSHHHFIKN